MFDAPACDDVIQCLTADPDVYNKAAFQFNTAQPENPDPCIIVMASTAECLQEVVKNVIKIRHNLMTDFQNLRIAIRGGRHSYIGASTVSKGVVVDVSRFDYIKQHNDNGSMTVGAGITLGNLYYELWNSMPSRLLYPGGTCPTVGLSGLTLGGGQGIVGRKYGLSVDQVIELKMVNSMGEILTVSNKSQEDLFWGLRGGGNGNFGIVYEFTLMRYKIPDSNRDYLIYYHDSSDWHTIISKWQNYITSSTFQDDHNIWSQLTVTPTFLLVAFHIASDQLKEASMEKIEEFTSIPHTSPSGYYPDNTTIECFYTPENYSGSIAFWAGCTVDNQCGNTQDLLECIKQPTDCGGEPFRMNSAYQNKTLTSEGIQTIIDHILQIKEKTGCLNASVQLDTLGGKINEALPNSTAFPHRNNIITYQFLSYFAENCNKTAMIEWQDEFHESMLKCSGMTEGAYRNYANLNLTAFNERYFSQNLHRLVDIKRQYDPHNLFNYSQSIPPSLERRVELVVFRFWPFFVLAGCAVILIVCKIRHCYSSGTSVDHEHKE
jgi:FAD/FMN-containing dehydrogenase